LIHWSADVEMSVFDRRDAAVVSEVVSQAEARTISEPMERHDWHEERRAIRRLGPGAAIRQGPDRAARRTPDAAAALEAILAVTGADLPEVNQRGRIASWAVNRRALPRGHGIRTELPDMSVLPDRTRSSANGDLVAAAVVMIAAARQ
jgi:hypothetical protein